MASRDCKKSADCFCYICGELTVGRQKKNIKTFVRQVYCAYFGVKIGDQDKTWAPHLFAKHVLKVLDGGQKVNKMLSDLEFQWYGESQKITAMIDTFVQLAFMGLI